MRIIVLAALLTAVFLPSRRACAQINLLFDHNLTFTGHIIQETGTNGTTVTKPITPATVLGALALTSTTTKLKFYFDSSTNSYVVAPKGIANDHSATPLATVLQLSGINIVSWNPNVNSTISTGSADGLDGDATGTFVDTEVIVRGTEISEITFVLSGSVNGLPTILEGKLTDTFHP